MKKKKQQPFRAKYVSTEFNIITIQFQIKNLKKKKKKQTNKQASKQANKQTDKQANKQRQGYKHHYYRPIDETQQ